MSVRSNLQLGSYEWLIGIVLSWWIPFQLIGGFHVTYFVSLLLWGVPVIALLPRFLRTTHRGSRRRQALLWSTIYIVVAGALLDFGFGGVILQFRCGERGIYVLKCLPAIGGGVPWEEVLFYILGGLAVLLVYAWSDQHWLGQYNVRKRRMLRPEGGHLIDLSWQVALSGAILWLLGVAWKMTYGGTSFVPWYYTFLIFTAFLPLIVLVRAVKAFVNWRALSFTGLYVMLTAALWEVTLALPECWWCYQPGAMIGKYVPAWSIRHPYPIEALMVWILVTFVGIFLYEAMEAYFYDDRPPLVRLFTGKPDDDGGGEGPMKAAPPPRTSPDGLSLIVRSSANDAGNAGEFLRQVARDERIGNRAFQLVIVGNDEGWRINGVQQSQQSIVCFADEHLLILPHVFTNIASVMESPRIVGGSTSATPDVPAEGFPWLLRRPAAWITGYDDGIAFCRAADFPLLPMAARIGTTHEFLSGLQTLGKKTKRVLTRVPESGVRFRSSVKRGYLERVGGASIGES